MTNKITRQCCNLFRDKSQRVSIIGSYLHQGFFSCQGEFEILSIYTNFANVSYSHVYNLIKMRLFCGF